MDRRLETEILLEMALSIGQFEGLAEMLRHFLQISMPLLNSHGTVVWQTLPAPGHEAPPPSPSRCFHARCASMVSSPA